MKPADESGTPLSLVLAFYRLVGKAIRNTPTVDVPEAELNQVLALLGEEVHELHQAVSARDVVKVADALADITYVIYGMAIQLGIDLDEVVREVHEANMTKPNADGSVARAGDGKILRGDSYEPPALEKTRAKWRLEVDPISDDAANPN